MRYGVYVPNFGPYGDAKVLADLAYEAEEAGWDSFFLWDQVSKTTLTPGVDPAADPWVALAAIAKRTQTIRLGTLVTPLPRRRPWMLAWETLSLDRLSAGRLIFGVGSGGGYFDSVQYHPKTLAHPVRLPLIDDAAGLLWFANEGSYRISPLEFSCPGTYST